MGAGKYDGLAIAVALACWWRAAIYEGSGFEYVAFFIPVFVKSENRSYVRGSWIGSSLFGGRVRAGRRESNTIS